MLYLTAALLDRRRQRDAERYVTMVGCISLILVMLAQHLPPLILPLLSLIFIKPGSVDDPRFAHEPRIG